MAETETTWDVRELLDEGLLNIFAEDEWLDEHKGVLGASKIGGCLRAEKFRLLGAPRVDHTTDRQKRRMLAGKMFAELAYRKALKAGRKPRREVPVEIQVDGFTILGRADFLFTEGVVEHKTTERYSMDEGFLPFAHLIQLGTYMFGLQRPGQLLYVAGMGGEEYSFDFPELPDVWEPHAQAVARLFADNTGDDVTPFPCERVYCASCAYLDVCPEQEPGAEEVLAEEHRTLLAGALARYEAAGSARRAAEKEEETAKAAVLGYRPMMGVGAKGASEVLLGNTKLTISDRSSSRLDQNAAKGLLEGAGLDVPMTYSSYPVLTVRTGGD